MQPKAFLQSDMDLSVLLNSFLKAVIKSFNVWLIFAVLDSQRWWNHNANDTSFLEFLLLHNANPNVEDHEGNSVLNVAFSKETSINNIRSLLKAGADPLHSGKDGLNAYQQAIEKGNMTLFLSQLHITMQHSFYLNFRLPILQVSYNLYNVVCFINYRIQIFMNISLWLTRFTC